MRTKIFARGLAAIVGLAVAVSVMAIPAFAAEPSGTASINPAHRTVVAGTAEAPFEITVNNLLTTGSGTSLAPSPNVNTVVIIPPASRYVPIPSGQAPNGWTGRLNSQKEFVFKTNGDGIGPGSSLPFTVTASVTRPTVDIDRRWRVYLSSDEGENLSEAAPASNGALTSTIRVLQVLSTKLTAPVGVTDNSATSGQTANAAVKVFNAGTGTLSVTPSLTSSRPSGSSATADVNCPGARSVAARTTTIFACTVTFGGSGGITLTGDAQGTHPDGDANGLPKSSDLITIMTAAAFSYVAESLQPTDVSPGKPFTFRLSVEKTGQVAVNLNKPTTRLSFGPEGGPTFSAALAEPTSVEGGSQDVLFEFSRKRIPVDIPANDPATPGRAEYTPTLVVTGADENDFAVSSSPDISDNIIVDALGPVIELTTTPPPSQVVGVDPAASDGQTVDFSGEIRDRGSLCGACPIVSAFIKQYDSSQVPIAADIPVVIENNGGSLSGSFDGTYDPAARFMALRVLGADVGGNTTVKLSNVVDVDNIEPLVTSAETGGGSNDRTKITAFVFDDGGRVATAAMSPSDWTVDGHRVIAAEAQPSPAGFDRASLTVNPQLGRNEEPNVTYSPSPATRANDRVGHDLPNATVLAIDGILPGLPVVSTISDMPRQDGQFFSNDTTPEVRVIVDPGDTLSLWVGAVSGAPDCQATAEGGQNQVVCTPTFAAQNATYELSLRSRDARGNIGPVAKETLSIDLTAPKIAGATLSGDDIEVTFTETLTTLRGRDNAIDWTVRGRESGETVTFKPNSVSGSGDKRTLHGNGAWNDPVNVTNIVYLFHPDFSSGKRYADRAGNELADQNSAV